MPYYNYALSHEWTDDAFIEGHIIQISSKVAGHVAQVHVSDNQEVKQGDLLVEIDAREYAARLAQARAALQAAIARQQAAQATVALTQVTAEAGIQQASSGVELTQAAVQTARAQVGSARSRFEQARAQVETALAHAAEARAQILAAEAEAIRAEADVKRLQELARRDQNLAAGPRSGHRHGRTANAQLEAARKKAAAGEAQVAEARAAQQTAAESLAAVGVTGGRGTGTDWRSPGASGLSCRRRATPGGSEPSAGRPRQRRGRAGTSGGRTGGHRSLLHADLGADIRACDAQSVEAGAYVHVGQALMAIVPRDVWVVANFMETQLADMRTGTAGRDHGRCLSCDALQRACRQYPGRYRRAFQPAAAGKRHRQLRQGGATHSRQDRLRRLPLPRPSAQPRDVGGPCGQGEVSQGQ